MNFDNNRNVYVNVGKKNGQSFIEVKNICRTLDANAIEKFFEKGFSTKSRYGRGYGLYSVKQIVNYYNGKIEIEFEQNNIIFGVKLT